MLISHLCLQASKGDRTNSHCHTAPQQSFIFSLGLKRRQNQFSLSHTAHNSLSYFLQASTVQIAPDCRFHAPSMHRNVNTRSKIILLTSNNMKREQLYCNEFKPMHELLLQGIKHIFRLHQTYNLKHQYIENGTYIYIYFLVHLSCVVALLLSPEVPFSQAAILP